MPDLQSELAKLASAWDAHEQAIRAPEAHAQQPQPTPEKTMTATKEATTSSPRTIVRTGNLSRDLFHYVQQGLYTRIQVAAAMALIGYSKKSASSITTQMLKAGLLVLRDGRLCTTSADYAPVANPTKTYPVRKYVRQATPTTKSREAKPKAAGLAALKETTPAPVQEVKPVRLVRMQTADEVLANMSVAEAHKLYVELGKMFGGK